MKYDRKDRNCKKALEWKLKVLKKGNNKCKNCSSVKSLVCHHMVEWHKNKELRFNVKNGEVLCRSCHMKHHGYRRSKKTKLKMSIAAKKVIHTKERNRKISEAKKGIKFSEEHKAKLSAAKKDYVPWNKGIPMSNSTKKKQSKRYKGKTWKIDPATGKRKWIEIVHKLRK